MSFFSILQESFHVAGFSVSGHVLERSEVSFALTLDKDIEDFIVVQLEIWQWMVDTTTTTTTTTTTILQPPGLCPGLSG